MLVISVCARPVMGQIEIEMAADAMRTEQAFKKAEEIF
jgi:hypothetical protein